MILENMQRTRINSIIIYSMIISWVNIAIFTIAMYSSLSAVTSFQREFLTSGNEGREGEHGASCFARNFWIISSPFLRLRGRHVAAGYYIP